MARGGALLVGGEVHFRQHVLSGFGRRRRRDQQVLQADRVTMRDDHAKLCILNGARARLNRLICRLILIKSVLDALISLGFNGGIQHEPSPTGSRGTLFRPHHIRFG